MKTRSLLALAAGCTLVLGCAGLKDAFTAHVDDVATAGGQKLSVTRLGTLIGQAPAQIPATRDVASIVAEYWVDYQLLGAAAADGDSLTNQKEIDEATRSYTTSMLLRHMQAHIDSSLSPTPPSEQTYDSGLNDVYAARHILFRFPLAATAAQKDSVRRRAAAVLPQVNARNFAAMAKKYSGDGSAAQGGNLGVFARGSMVPEFGDAVAALKPGQISPLVASEYGYHIIQRLTYADAKPEYDTRFTQLAAGAGERAYLAKLDSESNIQVKDGAAKVARVAVLDPSGRRNDKSVLASFNGGSLTVARFLMWMQQFPPNQRIPEQMQAAPDSILDNFIRNLATNEVLLQRADSMGLKLSPDELQGIYRSFQQAVAMSWNSLGVDPAMLADSAKTKSERERLAAARVDALIDGMMTGKVQPVPIPTPLKVLLEDKYAWKINDAGLDRAAELAKKVRASADSAAAVSMPKSEVPIPGYTPPAGTTSTSGKPGTAKPGTAKR
jgi:hypothetical protein